MFASTSARHQCVAAWCVLLHAFNCLLGLSVIYHCLLVHHWLTELTGGHSTETSGDRVDYSIALIGTIGFVHATFHAIGFQLNLLAFNWKIVEHHKLRLRQRIHRVYNFINGLLLLTCFVALSTTIFYRKTVLHGKITSVETAMGKAMTYYRTNVDVKRTFDKLQLTYQCCGVNNYTDWLLLVPTAERHSRKIKRMTTDERSLVQESGIPFSCCSVTSSKTPCANARVTLWAAAGQRQQLTTINTIGCADAVMKHLDRSGLFIIVIITSCCCLLQTTLFIVRYTVRLTPAPVAAEPEYRRLDTDTAPATVDGRAIDCNRTNSVESNESGLQAATAVTSSSRENDVISAERQTIVDDVQQQPFMANNSNSNWCRDQIQQSEIDDMHDPSNSLTGADDVTAGNRKQKFSCGSSLAQPDFDGVTRDRLWSACGHVKSRCSSLTRDELHKGDMTTQYDDGDDDLASTAESNYSRFTENSMRSTDYVDVRNTVVYEDESYTCRRLTDDKLDRIRRWLQGAAIHTDNCVTLMTTELRHQASGLVSSYSLRNANNNAGQEEQSNSKRHHHHHHHHRRRHHRRQDSSSRQRQQVQSASTPGARLNSSKSKRSETQPSKRGQTLRFSDPISTLTPPQGQNQPRKTVRKASRRKSSDRRTRSATVDVGRSSSMARNNRRSGDDDDDVGETRQNSKRSLTTSRRKPSTNRHEKNRMKNDEERRHRRRRSCGGVDVDDDDSGGVRKLETKERGKDHVAEDHVTTCKCIVSAGNLAGERSSSTTTRTTSTQTDSIDRLHSRLHRRRREHRSGSRRTDEREITGNLEHRTVRRRKREESRRIERSDSPKSRNRPSCSRNSTKKSPHSRRRSVERDWRVNDVGLHKNPGRTTSGKNESLHRSPHRAKHRSHQPPSGR